MKKTLAYFCQCRHLAVVAGKADGAGALVVVDEVGADATVDAWAGAALVNVCLAVDACES